MCLFRFLENFINYEEVQLLLDAILVIPGPFHALAVGIHVPRMAVPGSGPSHPPLSPSPASAAAARHGVSFSGPMINPHGPSGAALSPAARQVASTLI